MEICCITNRHLVRGDYWQRLEKIAASGVSSLIIREKDMEPTDYEAYAEHALALCQAYGVTCVLHHFSSVALNLGASHFHCSLQDLQQQPDLSMHIPYIGVSIHTLAEAREAQRLGAAYVIVGNVFPTACKPGWTPVGTATLKDICAGVNRPVYALGGMTAENLPHLAGLPLAGIVSMSGLMTCTDPPAYIQSLADCLQRRKS